MKRGLFVLLAVASGYSMMPNAYADEVVPRVREMTCTDGTVFTGEQVREGSGDLPRSWRNVDPGADPAALVVQGASFSEPNGATPELRANQQTIIDGLTFDQTQGVQQNHDLVTCSFVIPIGPLNGMTGYYTGFFTN